jgi:hypothetical protein
VTKEELIELKVKLQELEEIAGIEIVINADTGRCMYRRDYQTVFDMENVKHYFPLPEFQHLHDVIIEFNEMMAQYIRHYGKLPAQLYIQ